MIDINFDQIDKFISSRGADMITETETITDGEGKVEKITKREYPSPYEINVVRYEFMMRMIEGVMEYLNEIDQTLGVGNAIDKAPLTIQTYYDILLDKGIIKED